jgi:hypothetical protein
MKLISSVIAVAFLLAAPLGGFASDKPSAKPKDTSKTKVTKTDKAAKADKGQRQVALTGSYIKTDVRRNGVVTDGSNPVVVLDNEAIRNSGAADLRQLLVFRGVSH